ncbi:MAG: extracellular solute-binding protein [Treponema sp.]|nr:extracellular solute-binding protein [Treponema sp.]
MKKKLVLVSVCLMVLPLLGLRAAGRQGQGQAAAGAKPQISITILDRSQVPAAEGSYEDNRWTRWINENAPVNVKWVPIVRFESVQRTNALFAAGTAPDLVVEYNKPWMDNFYPQGVIQPMDDIINNHSAEYKAYLQKHPELLPYMTEDDGKIYGVSSARAFNSVINWGAYIRKDWCDKFGMKIPSTTAEILEFCRRVRDEDPDGNGRKDTYGFSWHAAGLGILQLQFGNHAINSLKIENGKAADWTTTQGYRDYLAFVSLLYREGYIDPEFVTDKPQYQRALQQLVTGKVGIFLWNYWMGENYWREFKTNVPSGEYTALEPWTTSQGRYGYFTEPPSNYMACMNAASKNGEDIMKFCDWLISEGWFTLVYGTEGRHYRLINGIPQTVDPNLNNVEKIYTNDYAFLRDDASVMNPDWLPVMAAQDALSQEYVKYQIDAINKIFAFPFRRDTPYAPTSEALVRFGNETRDQIESIETNIIMGNISLDEGIRQLNDYKNSFGWQNIIAERDVWYQQNRGLWR